MRRNVLAALTMIALASASAGCSSSGGSGNTCTTAQATLLSGALAIQGSAYHPSCFEISAGSMISIQNRDGVPHTFTFDELGTVSVAVLGGASGKATMPAAGTYGFHCSLHPQMTGTVIVR